MSKFLAPIHSWLFNKIQINESIEKAIINDYHLAGTDFEKQVYENYGELLPDTELEALIDQSNIHGWLQNRIHITEGRMAEWITYVAQQSPDNLKALTMLFFEKGQELGRKYNFQETQDPKAAFKALQDVLLEGMPCDHVNQVIQEDGQRVIWQTTVCLHSRYYERIGGNVDQYYKCRCGFINGLIKAVHPRLGYLQSPVEGANYKYLNEISLH